MVTDVDGTRRRENKRLAISVETSSLISRESDALQAYFPFPFGYDRDLIQI